MTFQLTNPSGKKKKTQKNTKESMAGFQAFLQRIVQ